MADDNRARDLLRHVSVGEEHPQLRHLYILGSFETRVTIAAQQARAHNLVYALFAEGRLSTTSRIVVIGGGIAGLTVAAAALAKGCHVTLLEREHILVHQQDNCQTRWVHPTLYDWPSDTFRAATTGEDIPFLGWRAARAGDVANQIRSAWNEVHQRNEDRIVVHKSVRDVRLSSSQNPNQAQVFWNPGAESVAADAVVLAIGFGVEKQLPPQTRQSYWTDDRFHQYRQGATLSVLVSGCGDGGLADVLRAKLRDFTPDEAYTGPLGALLASSDLAGVRARLLTIEHESQSQADRGEFLSSHYRRLVVPPEIDDLLKSRIRGEFSVTLNGPTAHPLSPTSSILHRFLISRLIFSLNAVDYWFGRIAPGAVTRTEKGWSVSLDAGPAKLFDELVVRHGADSAIRVSFPELWPMLDPVLRARNRFDRTRERIWPLDWYPHEQKTTIQDPASVAIAAAAQTAAPPLVDNLPPRESIVSSFVGRHNELQSLHRWFRDPASHRFMLVGEGGLGKTSLAYEFATEIRQAGAPDLHAIFWLSAKKKRFEDGETIDIDRPDFSDITTALEQLSTRYGLPPEDNLQLRKEAVVRALSEHAALLVIDDIDSLKEDDEAVEFFSYEAPHSASKVLLTSRRTILGMGRNTMEVKGLTSQDAELFIRYQCGRAGIDSGILSPSLVADILEATSSSPLYIEDLLRFFCISPKPSEAIARWKDHGGDDAREYALGREFEKLTLQARKVLAASCVAGRTLTLPELSAISGVIDEPLERSLTELYRLFLVPKPTFVDGEPRFTVNVNTRTLVQRVASTKYPDLWGSVARALASIAGDTPKVVGRASTIIRRAYFFVRSGDYALAEQLLRRELEREPDTAQLLAYLGWVYKAWEPPRITDARECFERAWQLKWRQPEMYRHWSDMECRQREWTRGAEAAEHGLALMPQNPVLLSSAGYARSRLGRDLRAQLLSARARDEFRRAQVHLHAAVKNAYRLNEDRASFLPLIYRALYLNSDCLGDTKTMTTTARAWRSEFPDDRELPPQLLNTKRRPP